MSALDVEVIDLFGHAPRYVQVNGPTLPDALRGLADLVEERDTFVLSITTEFITTRVDNFLDDCYYAVYAVLDQGA